MNVVRALIKKKIQHLYIANCTFIQFSNDLAPAESKHKGFIKSTNYWENVYNYDVDSNLYIIQIGINE